MFQIVFNTGKVAAALFSKVCTSLLWPNQFFRYQKVCHGNRKNTRDNFFWSMRTFRGNSVLRRLIGTENTET